MKIRWPRILTPTQLSQFIRSEKNPLRALHIFKEAKLKYPNYSHNGPAYATMIRILADSGLIPELNEVIDLMRKDSCECKDTVFAYAIKSYAKAELLDEAVALFRSLPHFNCVNWTESFNTIVRLLVEQAQLETAVNLFLENCQGWGVKSRVRALNLLIGALCRCCRSDLALEVFQEMYSQCCYPDRETYLILMRGLCEDGKLNEAIHLLYSMLWRISKKGSGEDVVVYTTLLNALCDHGHVRDAVDVLGKILRKGHKATKLCRKHLNLMEYSSNDDIQHVKVLINESLIRGGIPSSASYTAMAVNLYSQGCISDGDKVFDVMLERGFKPSLPMYEARVAALCEEGRMDEAVDVIEKEMGMFSCLPSARAYNFVIKGLCHGKQSILAVEYLNKMVRRVSCVPNKETYQILVDGLCRESKFLDASRVMDRMVTKSHFPDVNTYNILIRGLCLMGRKYDVVVRLEEMVSQGKRPNIFVWESLVGLVCRVVDAETCTSTNIFDRLRSSSV